MKKLKSLIFKFMKILVNFYANVTEQSVNNLILFVTQQLAQQNPQKVYDELIIQSSSSGGSSDHGLLAYNFLKQISIKKTTIGMGNVDSAAVLIFLAGDKRIAMHSCRFLMHESKATLTGEFTSHKLQEILRMLDRITADYATVISKVITSDESKILSEIKVGKVLSSDEAKAEKLVTEIVEEPYLKDMKDLDILLIQNPIN